MQAANTNSSQRNSQNYNNQQDSVDAINNASRDVLEQVENYSSKLEQTLNRGALDVFRWGDRQIARSEQYLNRGSLEVLKIADRSFGSLSEKLNNWASGINSTVAKLARPLQPKNQTPLGDAARTISTGAGAIDQLKVATNAVPKSITGSLIGGGFSVANALTGAAASLGQFSVDVDRGDNDYSRTMMRSSATTAQTLATTYGMIGLGTAVSSIGTVGLGAAAIAAAPAALALGAAVGIGYLANQWIY